MKKIISLPLFVLVFSGVMAQCNLSLSVSPVSSCFNAHDTLRVSGASGASQLLWTSGGNMIHTASASPIDTVLIVAGIGGLGSAANQLNAPMDMYIDPSGNIYVCDEGNNRIQKFAAGSTSGTNGVTVAGGNGAGSAANQLNDPRGLYVNAAGDIYVADSHNHRIQKFASGSTSATNAVTVAGGNGSGSAANKLSYPQDVYLDQSGNIYVVDGNNYRVQEFPAGSNSSTSATTVAGGTPGPGLDELSQPTSLLIDNSNNLYVLDQSGERVVMFPPGSSAGTFGTVIAGNNGGGIAANQFFVPKGIFFDGTGNLYVADQGNNRIQKFPPGSTSTTNGVTIHATIVGSAPGQFNSPSAIYIDASGNLYEADQGNGRIQEFTTVEVNNDTVYLPSSPGTYTAIATAQSGCTDTVTAIVYPQAARSYSYTYCGTGSVTVGTHTYHSTGTYIDTLAGASIYGCDSIVTTIIQIDTLLVPTITLTNNTLSTQSYTSYQWINNGQVIPGATSQTLTVTQNGNFSVIVSNTNGCSDTSTVFQVTRVGIDDIKDNVSVNFYPNPCTGVIHISISKIAESLYIYDITGRVLYSKSNVPIEDELHLEGLSKGIYHFEVNINGIVVRKRVVME